MEFKTILYRIHDGDEYAFRELYEFFLPGLISFAASILKNRSQAEDVVEDVFLKLWENRKSLINIQRVSFYLYKAVRYTSIDAIERQKKFISISFDEVGESFSFTFEPEDDSLINKENCLKISNAINQLPTRCRLIFRLIKEEGMKYREVADLLNLSEKTVENQMNIAVKKLINVLKPDFPEFSSFFSSKK